jgi:hypothetical protein
MSSGRCLQAGRRRSLVVRASALYLGVVHDLFTGGARASPASLTP